MAIDALSVLYTGLFLAVAGGLYGLLVAVFWSPFLLAGRVRRLFELLPPADWWMNYVVWTPLPAMVWGFIWGIVVPVSREVRPPTRASELYVAGVDGIVLATVISILLWPILLVFVLPSRGFDWYAEDRAPTTVALVVGGTVWYLLFLVVPMYVFVIFAGFGDAMAHT